jgi:hypothetical protein
MAQGSRDIPVDSTLIRSVTYGTDATLTVRFHSGAVYRYFTVPRSILDAIPRGHVKGRLFQSPHPRGLSLPARGRTHPRALT